MTVIDFNSLPELPAGLAATPLPDNGEVLPDLIEVIIAAVTISGD